MIDETVLSYQDFDSAIFEMPFFRLVPSSRKKIIENLRKLAELEEYVVDAKVDAQDLVLNRLLQELGFKKVCMQVEFQVPCSQYFESDPVEKEAAIRIETVTQLPPAVITRHAEQFKYDRFSLDIDIPEGKRVLLFSKWISNSMRNPDIYVARLGHDFCSFRTGNNVLVIDLLSVLTRRRGVGSLLIQAVGRFAAREDLELIRVKTECENPDSVPFYIKNGFQVSRFISCFHLVHRLTDRV